MYRRDGFAGATRERLDRGELCLYMASRDGRMALIQLALRAFFGRLEPERDFVLARLKSIEISAPRRRLRVAIDGESFSNFNRTPLRNASTCAARAQSLTASFNDTRSLFKAARVFMG